MLRLQPGLGIQGLPLEAYESGTGEYLGAVAGEAFSTLNVPSILRYAERFGESGEDPQALAPSFGDLSYFAGERRRQVMDARPLSRELTAQEANERYGSLGLKFTAPVRERVAELLAERKKELQAYHSVFDRARANGDLGLVKGSLSVATEFLTGLADPLNVLAAFMPIVGPTRYAAWAARMGAQRASLLKGGIEGATGTAAIEPFNAVFALDEQRRYTAAEALTNIALGTVLGGGLHWLVGRVVGEPELRARTPEAPRPGDAPILDRVTAELLSPEPEAVRPGPRAENAVPPPAPDRTIPQPMAEAIERVQPETKEAALRTAVAQVLQERRPDVEPILRADPAWRAPVAAAYEGPPARFGRAVDVNTILRERAAARAEIERLQAAAAEQRALYAGDANAKAFGGQRFAVPAEFKPSFKELNEARKVQAETRRGAGPEPMRLLEYIAKSGGISAAERLLGDLAAIGITPKTKIKGRFVIREGGRTLDYWGEHLGENADFGIYKGRPTVEELLEIIGEDFGGGRPFYMDPDAGAAWRRAMEALERAPAAGTIAGQPAASLTPRETAYLLRLDPLQRRMVELEDKMARGEITEREAVERAGELDRAMADARQAEWEAVKAEWDAYTRDLDPDLVPEHPGEYVGRRPEEFDALERSIRDDEDRANRELVAASDAGRAPGGREEPGGLVGEGGDAGTREAALARDAGVEPQPPAASLQVPRFEQARVSLEARVGRLEPAFGRSEASPISRLTTDELETYAKRQQDPAGDFAGARDPVFDADPPKQDLPELDRQAAELEARLGERLTDTDRAAIAESGRAADDFLRAGAAYLACKAED